MRRNRPFRAEIVTRSARVKVSTIEVAVGNGPRYGGGMRMQDAALDDHLLHVYSLRPMRVREMIPVLVRLRRGSYADHDKVDVLAAEWLELRTSRPHWITVDGELRTRTPAQFRVLRAALQVLAPPVETGGEE